MSDNSLPQQITKLCQDAKSASLQLAQLDDTQKQQALLAMADQLEQQTSAILAANKKDVAAATAQGVTAAFLDRLLLDEQRLKSTVAGLKAIAQLPDPVGTLLKKWQVPSGLEISRISVPLGVLGIIYEARPNVTVDAAALAFKAGNAAILRGGSECVASNKILTHCLQEALISVGINKAAIQYVPTQDCNAVDILLSMDEYIDVIVPRGGKSLIERIRERSRLPVFSHLNGICHTYIHQAAQLEMAKTIVLNAKMRRTGICGAKETLLIDAAIAKTFLPEIINTLLAQHCEVRGDEVVQALDKRVIAATEEDWHAEYLDAVIAIKTVSDIEAAITHINHYGSHHTDAIITNDKQAAQLFLQQVNSAIVMHNRCAPWRAESEGA